MFDTGLSRVQILANVQTRLSQLRTALQECDASFSWSSGVAAADLVAVGFTTADANALLSAIADAHALNLIYTTGLPPGTYPQPASVYVYQASHAKVIGP